MTPRRLPDDLLRPVLQVTSSTVHHNRRTEEQVFYLGGSERHSRKCNSVSIANCNSSIPRRLPITSASRFGSNCQSCLLSVNLTVLQIPVHHALQSLTAPYLSPARARLMSEQAETTPTSTGLTVKRHRYNPLLHRRLRLPPDLQFYQ